MRGRKMLPGEREAWDLACDDKRWVVRTIKGHWLGNGGWRDGVADASAATLASRHMCVTASVSTDTIAYRARSVRADGTPVVP